MKLHFLRSTIAIGASLYLANNIAFADTNSKLSSAAAQPAEVHVQGNTIYYRGNFSLESTKVFTAATAKVKPGQILTLVISSVGGDTDEARTIGTWVHDHALVVEVDEICFSSCANYIFPAGRSRVIYKDAFVGWHGNERGRDIEAAQRGANIRSEYKRLLPKQILEEQPELVERYVDQMIESAKLSQRKEGAYFSMLGLKDTFSVCGVGDVAVEKYPQLKDKKGWGFSIKDMELLGIKQITYRGEGVYEKDSANFTKYLGLLSADDCVSLLN